MPPIRILQVMPAMDAGGMETFVMNVYRTIDREKVQFDFLYHYDKPCFFDDEIRALGGRIFKLTVRQDNNLPRYLRELRALFAAHPEWRIIHGHYSGFGMFYSPAARRAGMEYFEMSHLFTQWGALHAPKIMADTDAGPVRVFGWETAACSPEYAGFLRALLPQLMDELRALGIADHTYFHISDEPCESMLEDYAAARALVAPYVDGCPIIDALSSLKFYASGIVKKPIPGINHLQEFVDAGVPGLWTYYCVSQYKAVSNLFMAMPAARTRMLGAQLYKYDIEGFLQWGYNFYNSQYSLYPIDPYAVTDADGVFPAGDAFQVYPGANGEPEESIRLLLCHMAMQDLCALRWLESLTSRAHVLSLLSDCAGGPLTLVDYPRSADFFARLRAAVNREILERKGLAFHS